MLENTVKGSGSVTKRLKAIWAWIWPILLGMLYALPFVVIVFLLVIPSPGEITAEKYRWLSEQAKAFPEIAYRIDEELSDDGRISYWELNLLERQIEDIKRGPARKELLQQLREARNTSDSVSYPP